MIKLQSQLNLSSEESKKRKEDYLSLLHTLSEFQHKARNPESSSVIEKLKSQNKHTLLERISNLVDLDSPILEIGLLAGLKEYPEIPPGAGVYGAIGKISGRLSMIIANIPSVKGGSYHPLSVKKHLRAQEIAFENKLPVVSLVDSGGAFLPLQSEVFPDKDDFGRIFYNQAQMSKAGIPQIAAVLGLCTAGGAYVPAMSEQVIMVAGNSTIFLGGPPLVKAATGEIVTAEELGGSKVHNEISGLSDYEEQTELDAILRVRSILEAINDRPIRETIKRSQDSREPEYDPEELYSLLPQDVRQPVPALELIARIVDESRFDEFKSGYGETLKCGFSHIDGFLVGIIANDGILFGESALKGAHFIDLCDKRRIPLVFLQNITGFMIGKEYEHSGIAKHGAKMVTAVSTCTVPKYTIMAGGSFGAGNYSMCGRAFGGKFLFSYPHSKISVMGGIQAAKVLTEIKKAGNTKVTEQELNKLEQETINKFEQEGNAFYATSCLWDDGIIDPKKTRETLSIAIQATSFDQSSNAETLGIFRM